MIHTPRFAAEFMRYVREVQFLFFAKDFWIKDFLKYRWLFTNNDSDKGGRGSAERGPGGRWRGARPGACRGQSLCRPGETGDTQELAGKWPPLQLEPSDLQHGVQRALRDMWTVVLCTEYLVHKQEVSTTRSQTIMTTCGTRLCASDAFFIQLSWEKTKTHHSSPLNKEQSYLM